MAWKDQLDALRADIEDLQEATGASDREVAAATENVLRRQDVIDPFRAEDDHRDTIFRLAWWMFVRAPALDLRHFIYSSMALEVIQSGARSLGESLDDLAKLEENYSLDSPAPPPIEVTDDVESVQEAFRENADQLDELSSWTAEEIEPRLSGVVGELLQQDDFFRELSRAITEDLMEQFGAAAEGTDIDEALESTPVGDGHGHQHDYDDLDEAAEYVERADKRYQHGDVDGAVEDYTAAIEAGVDNEAEIYRKRGVAKAAMDDVDGAIDDWTQTLEIDPENVGALVDRALAHLEREEPREALQDYNRAADIEESAEVFANRGVARFQTGDAAGAMEDLDRAVELDEESIPSHLNRAMIRRATGDLEGAFDDYARAIEIDENCADAYSSRGFLRLEKGEVDEAIEDFDNAIEARPHDATNYYNRGNAYAELGEWRDAVEDYDEAIELDPEDALAFSNRGSAKVQMQDFQGAIDDWNKAIDLDPHNPIPYVKRAGVWNLLDQENEAVGDLTTALDVAPEDWELRPRVEQMLKELANN